ncbi:MAG: alpha-1,4-glucan--maltose-1-phosphate maltosyltransferase [Acidimicrobiia bacterium]
MQVKLEAELGRIPIVDVGPVVGCGRWPAKAVVGESVEVSATVFREAQERLGAAVVLRTPGGEVLPGVRMQEVGAGLDRWSGRVTPTEMGSWSFRVEAWGDPIAHWWDDAQIKIPRGQDVDLMFAEGSLLYARAAEAVPGKDRPWVERLARRLGDVTVPVADRMEAVADPDVESILERHPLRDLLTVSDWYPLTVHRQRALYGAWYEFFPRSEGATIDPLGRRAPTSGTLHTATQRLPAIAAMGFDVIYLPPIHPIGTTHRKGPNNTLDPHPHHPGSPWAIGTPAGGHDTLHPDLGTLHDFDTFIQQAAHHGLEIALDLALQCSPDHPWIHQHPEWFTTRTDGTIAHAENPPKQYQDIYPLNFDHDPDGLYHEIHRIVRHWMNHGVRIFRVDNPHTKPLTLWERLLTDINTTDPDVIFLAEAFTRPAIMHTLAKIGFHQSYTYFTWRNTAHDLREYFTELTGPTADYMRPNCFTNTPDILNHYLQHGGRPAFEIRAILAATLSPTWGIYTGYELCENTPVRPGSEEYRDSEKYQYRPRDWDTATRTGHTIAPLITRLNTLRNTHPALQQLRNLHFHHIDQPELLAYSKHHHGDTVLTVINLNPHQPRQATLHLDLPALGLPDNPHQPHTVTDQLNNTTYTWTQTNYIHLDPHTQPAHILTFGNGET